MIVTQLWLCVTGMQPMPNSLQCVHVYRLLLGERPYWWVHTNSDWPSDQRIHQVYITCETGPGIATMSFVKYLYTSNTISRGSFRTCNDHWLCVVDHC